MAGQTMVCPWWLCYTFDNPLRHLLQKPQTILAPWLKPGDNVIDIGCGMGYFTIPMAKLVGETGRVIAVDLQPRMLTAVVSRAQKNAVSDRIKTVVAKPDSIGSHDPADFILAFWMVHEVPDQRGLLMQIRDHLKPDGQFLLCEPKIHVLEKAFMQTLRIAEEAGLVVVAQPAIRLSRSALLALKSPS